MPDLKNIPAICFRVIWMEIQTWLDRHKQINRMLGCTVTDEMCMHGNYFDVSRDVLKNWVQTIKHAEKQAERITDLEIKLKCALAGANLPNTGDVRLSVIRRELENWIAYPVNFDISKAKIKDWIRTLKNAEKERDEKDRRIAQLNAYIADHQ